MTGTTVVGAGVAMLRNAVDALMSAPINSLPSADLLAVFADIEVQRNRLAALDHRRARPSPRSMRQVPCWIPDPARCPTSYPR